MSLIDLRVYYFFSAHEEAVKRIVVKPSLQKWIASMLERPKHQIAGDIRHVQLRRS